MASKNISFDNIPSSIRKPGKYFEFNTKLAVRTLPNNHQRMLIVGQRTTAGKINPLLPVQVFSDKEAESYFGAGSICHLMSRAAIKANPYLDLTVVAQSDNGAGVAASGNITVSGTATGAATLSIYVANKKVDVPVAKDDDASTIAASIHTELAKHSDLPVTISISSNIVILTAKNKGLCGNNIGIQTNTDSNTLYVPGVTISITQMHSGDGNPDIQDCLDRVVSEQFDLIVTPYNNEDDLIPLRDHLDFVSGPLEQRPGIGVYGMNGSLSAATTLSEQVNSGRILCAYLRYTAGNSMKRSLSYEIASAIAAIMAFEEDPARPLNTLELKGIAVADIEDRLSRTEQESLLYNGVTPIEIGPGERVQVVRAISTYLEDAQGIEDVSLLDITTIRTLDYVRKACRERIAQRFPREKLSSKTPPKVKSELLDVLKKLEDLEIVEEVEANKDGLIVERDEQDANRLNAKIPCDVVNGLHVFAGRIDLLL